MAGPQAEIVIPPGTGALTPVFSPHTPRWWGSAWFLAADSAALALLAAAYVYVGLERAAPGLRALPDLRIPALNLVLMLVSALPMWYAATIARHRGSRRAIGSWLSLCVMLGMAFAVLRVAEFWSIRVRPDAGVEAALVWVMLAAHLAHIVGATAATLVLAAAMLRGPSDDAHFTGVMANARYWYFVVASWLVLYPIVFLAPRFI